MGMSSNGANGAQMQRVGMRPRFPMQTQSLPGVPQGAVAPAPQMAQPSPAQMAVTQPPMPMHAQMQPRPPMPVLMAQPQLPPQAMPIMRQPTPIPAEFLSGAQMQQKEMLPRMSAAPSLPPPGLLGATAPVQPPNAGNAMMSAAGRRAGRIVR